MPVNNLNTICQPVGSFCSLARDACSVSSRTTPKES
ncbi:MAG: hypothetical protein GVY22_15095 [Gammaproteobacteria bacterium]|nr:hypothetical protein [Gammaproteobacteria bacterium]